MKLAFSLLVLHTRPPAKAIASYKQSAYVAFKYRIRTHKSSYYECWTAYLAGKYHQLGLWTRVGFHRMSQLLCQEGGYQLFPLPPCSPE